MKQQNADIDPEEELQNAMDEIKRNEKDLNMIAIVAKTFLEKNKALQQQAHEKADEVTFQEEM